MRLKDKKMTLTALDIVRFDLNPKVICWIADYKCISANFKHHNAVDLVLRLSFNNLTPTLKKQQIQFKNNNNQKTNGYNFKKFKQNTSHEWQWEGWQMNCDCYLTARDAPCDKGSGDTSHLTGQIDPPSHLLCQLNLPLCILDLGCTWGQISSNSALHRQDYRNADSQTF